MGITKVINGEVRSSKRMLEKGVTKRETPAKAAKKDKEKGDMNAANHSADGVKKATDGVDTEGVKKATDGVDTEGVKKATDGVETEGVKKTTDGVETEGVKKATDGVETESVKKATDGVKTESVKKATDVQTGDSFASKLTCKIVKIDDSSSVDIYEGEMICLGRNTEKLEGYINQIVFEDVWYASCCFDGSGIHCLEGRWPYSRGGLYQHVFFCK